MSTRRGQMLLFRKEKCLSSNLGGERTCECYRQSSFEIVLHYIPHRGGTACRWDEPRKDEQNFLQTREHSIAPYFHRSARDCPPRFWGFFFVFVLICLFGFFLLFRSRMMPLVFKTWATSSPFCKLKVIIIHRCSMILQSFSISNKILGYWKENGFFFSKLAHHACYSSCLVSFHKLWWAYDPLVSLSLSYHNIWLP